MRVLSKACAVSMACPGVSDPEDGSGELIVTGHDRANIEVEVRIDRALIEDAVAALKTTKPEPAGQR